MDRFQHIDESDSERFRDILTAMTKDGTFSSLYHLDSPFRLHFLSFHPEKEDDCYGAAIIAPDEAVSYTLSRESVMPTLKNTILIFSTRTAAHWRRKWRKIFSSIPAKRTRKNMDKTMMPTLHCSCCKPTRILQN